MTGFSGPPAAAWRNRLVNGEFETNQRLITAPADDAYVHDRWYALTQANPITVGTQATPESGQNKCIRLTQSNASSQRMGLAQIIESANCIDLRTFVAALSGRVRCSSSQAIRYAILSQGGTADVVTSDVVSDWTSGTYTPGNFFIASTAVVAIGTLTPSAAVWTPITPIIGAPNVAMTNVIVFVWTEAVAAQNVTLDIGLMQLESGSAPTPFERRSIASEIVMCQRYYEKSFLMAVAPVTNAGLQTGEERWQSPTAGATLQELFIKFQTSKRIVPPSPVFYNPSAANAQIRDATASADCTSTSTNFSSQRGMLVTGSSPAGTAAGNQMALHWTVDVEL